METTTDVIALARLREPFPAAVIGKLPKVTCKACSKKNCSEHRQGKCSTCKAFISTQHIHVDYIGHAEVTDRLLEVDPSWSWEPFAVDATGLPAIASDGAELSMWIRLTVCGVTRPGVGTVAVAATESTKQLISDALRNAAMRFGVGLDLWAKSDLAHGTSAQVDDDIDPATGSVRTTATRPAPAPQLAPAPAAPSPTAALGADDPFRPFDESNEVLAGPMWARKFMVAMTASGHEAKVAEAVVHYATGGTTRDGRAVLKSQVKAVASTHAALDAGKLAPATDDKGRLVLVEVAAAGAGGAAA